MEEVAKLDTLITEEVAQVVTFYDDDTECVMTLLSVNENGLCKCLYENAHEGIAVRVGRHRNRVRPLNATARHILEPQLPS